MQYNCVPTYDSSVMGPSLTMNENSIFTKKVKTPYLRILDTLKCLVQKENMTTGLETALLYIQWTEGWGCAK